MFKVQLYDTDCECWQDDEDIQPSKSRTDAEDDMRAAKRRCAYPVKMRVVTIYQDPITEKKPEGSAIFES